MAFKKPDINYQTSKNSPYEQTDYSYDEKLKKSIEARNNDDSRDAHVITYKKSKKAFSHFLFVDDCDIQSGGQGYEAIRHTKAVDYVMGCYNLIYGIGGDLHDNGNIYSATDVHGNRISPSESIIAMQSVYEKYKGKISYIISGNHEGSSGSRLIGTNLSMSKHSADLLSADHIPFALIYTLPVLTPDTNKPKDMNIFIMHNSKGNKSSVVDNSYKQIVEKYLKENNILIDIIQTEHMHTNSEGIYEMQVPQYEKNGKYIGDMNHQVYVVNGSSWQNGNTTYGANNLFSSKPNLKALDLSWEINPYYTYEKRNKEPRYKAMVNAFNVLKTNSNEASLAMKAYMKSYTIDLSKYKNKINKLSANQLIGKMDTITTELKTKTATKPKKTKNSNVVNIENYKEEPKTKTSKVATRKQNLDEGMER